MSELTNKVIVEAESRELYALRSNKDVGRKILLRTAWKNTFLTADQAYDLIRALLNAVQEIEGRS